MTKSGPKFEGLKVASIFAGQRLQMDRQHYEQQIRSSRRALRVNGAV